MDRGDLLEINILRNGKWKKFFVKRFNGTLLSYLTYIKKNFDRSLSFEYNCRAGYCGSCGVMMNGKPVLACETFIGKEIKKIYVYPKINESIIKDLFSYDFEKLKVRKRILKKYPFKTKKKPFSKIIPEKLELFREMEKCIECGLCMAACPNLNKNWVGPMHAVFITKLNSHPLDIFDRSKLLFELGLYSCNTNFSCQNVCPKNIRITQNALIPQKEENSLFKNIVNFFIRKK